MKIIDISVGIRNDMLLWPGEPPVEISWESRIDQGAEFNDSFLRIGAHSGTHIDMPLHFIDGAANTDDLDLSRLIGPVTVVEVPDEKGSIDAAFLESLGLEGVTRLLFKTPSGKRWDDPSLPFDEELVALDRSGAEWVVENRCEMVGIDYLSIAPHDDIDTTHQILLSNNVIVLETLDLRKVQAGEYELICLPLKLIGREAAPARAILIKE